MSACVDSDLSPNALGHDTYAHFPLGKRENGLLEPENMDDWYLDDGSVLTVKRAARILRDVRRNKAYRAYPLGMAVGRYLRWLRNEFGATERTREDYESILRRFSYFYLDLEVKDFDPPMGTERIREFIDEVWGDVSASTRAKATSILKSFFRWAHEMDLVAGDPTLKIRRPRKAAVERHAHDPEEVKSIIRSQPSLRDQVAISLMARLGLRKNELRMLRYRDIDLHHREILVHGKGQKIATIPIVYEELRIDIERLIQDEGGQPDHYLLYPVHVGNMRTRSKHMQGVVREDRHKPMVPSGMHRWWKRCLERANAKDFPMHELRHTAGTEFMRATGDLKLTQKFMRHASIATTADEYLHLDTDDLIEGMRAADARWKGEAPGGRRYRGEPSPKVDERKISELRKQVKE